METLRFWGLVVSSALIALALWIAALGPEEGIVEATSPAGAHAAETPATPVSFLVRFRGAGPIARAQAAAESGRTTQAQRRIETELDRQSAFAGLCFGQFIPGGASMVLRTCDPVTPDARADVEASWLRRLRDMRAVAYAEVGAATQAD